jgi:hypothetical protein
MAKDKKKQQDKIQLGDRVRERITGVEGIVWGISKWLTGCDHIGIKREGVDKDGKPWDCLWFDAPHVTVLQKAVIDEKAVNPVDPVTEQKKGGPLPSGITHG